MKKRVLKISLLTACLILLAGCGSTQQSQIGPPSFGNAVKQNMAAQIVHPNAGEKTVKSSFNGVRMELAQKRYMVDAVEKAAAPKTSKVDSGSSGGK